MSQESIQIDEATSRAALAELARYADAIAPRFCNAGIGPGKCDWYHGFWPYLRLLGLGSAPDRHGEFFARALGDAARSGECGRVLITGTADFEMAAQVFRGFQAVGVQPQVTVLDRCPTPGRLCQWYAAREGLRIRNLVADALHWQPVQTFDLVCTHSLFPLFSAAERELLVRAWHRYLRPGGLVVTVSRVGESGGDGQDIRAADPGKALADKAIDLALASGFSLLPMAELTRRAELFGCRLPVYAMGTADETRTLFEANGFVLEAFDLREREGQSGLSAGAVGVNKTAKYAEIVARRAATGRD